MYEMISELPCCCCGCGNPERTYKAIHEMLLYFDERIDKPWTDLSDNPYIQFMAYVLDNEGFMEHGTNINYAWLTDKGKQLVAYLDDFSKYDYEIDDVPLELLYVEKPESV